MFDMAGVVPPWREQRTPCRIIAELIFSSPFSLRDAANSYFLRKIPPSHRQSLIPKTAYFNRFVVSPSKTNHFLLKICNFYLIENQ